MAYRFFHIGINMLFSEPEQKAIDAAMSAFAGDWMRYTFNCYIVWTDKSAQQVTDLLRPTLANYEYLVLPIDPLVGMQGYLKQWIWDWMNQRRHPTQPIPYLPNLPPLPPIPPRRLGAPPFPPKKP